MKTTRCFHTAVVALAMIAIAVKAHPSEWLSPMILAMIFVELARRKIQ
jgi:hypothetical protein